MKNNLNISSIFSKIVSPNEELHKAVLIEHEERNPTVYGIPILDNAMKIQYVDFYSSSLKIGKSEKKFKTKPPIMPKLSIL